MTAREGYGCFRLRHRRCFGPDEFLADEVPVRVRDGTVAHAEQARQ
ncbi:MAG: hypothetical protein ACXVHX_33115 [Solirubrobacteraceae bacterium]